jgi:hypothetical protein
MSVLWIAFGIYIVGIATLLVLRPASMFHSDGSSWKEFGLSSNTSHTVFPFWMFAIIWAIISYALATLGMMFVATITLRSEYNDTMNAKPISNVNTNPPGYYVLNDASSTTSPKYIFYGPEPPQ